ncbi:hypothetical protein M011DRAFT_466504 [Sporormia fimetaria CBS 119925]|uniref:Ricin B lectin domain-containing protein n=1 Tax=Sporormia fimetaria CBS 119925 TaxID=1340428 RepID=A0A6A6VG76_9PLEO|nr:hypothetical protein M011DRAFT_466504 [Sporormia fimetaria CBS 119925]
MYIAVGLQAETPVVTALPAHIPSNAFPFSTLEPQNFPHHSVFGDTLLGRLVSIPSPLFYEAAMACGPKFLDDASEANTEFSTICSIKTPPSTVAETRYESQHLDIHSDIPWPGFTYLITDAKTNHSLTLRKGELEMAPAICNHDSSVHWEVFCDQGRIGLRHAVSGNFLGYNLHDSTRDGRVLATLNCKSDCLRKQDNIVFQHRPGGGYVLHFSNSSVAIISEGDPIQFELGRSVTLEDGTVFRFTKI